MLELWKPLQMLNTKPLVFTETCMYYEPERKSYRPFVIFYQKETNEYYYLKSRTKTSSSMRPKKGEILIKGSGDENTLLSKDSFIDCSQIFKIDAGLLESAINKHDIKYKNTPKLNQDYIDLILDKINECVNEIPPFLSILEIYSDTNIIKAKSLYLCQEKYNKVFDLFDEGIYFVPKNKTIEDFAPTEKKLQEAYKFKKMFNEAFKEKQKAQEVEEYDEDINIM